MSPRIQLAYTLLWTAHPVLQLAVAGLMFWRKLHRVFPVFFAYILSQIVTFAIVYPAYNWGSYPQFFYSYWICAALSLALGFKVIHEIFLDVFRPYHTLKDLGSVLFRWAALVMLLVAAVVAASSPVSAEGPIVQSVMTVERCVRVIQVGLIMFLLVFSKYLGVSWRQHSFGISLGFGLFGAAELLVIALQGSSHLSELATGLINMAAYNCCVVIWITYVALKKQVREAAVNLPMSHRWEQSLGDIHRPASQDSLIPMFEGMVDRALSRSSHYDEHELRPESSSSFGVPIPEMDLPTKK